MSRSSPADGECRHRMASAKARRREIRGRVREEEKQISGAGSREAQNNVCSPKAKERPGFRLLDQKDQRHILSKTMT